MSRFTVCLFAYILFALPACSRFVPRQTPGNATPTVQTMTRTEFDKVVPRGSAEEEVIAALGKPDETNTWGREALWFYLPKTLVIVDPITGNRDACEKVPFTAGRVISTSH